MAEHEGPDLHEVEEKIHAAHDAEDRLMHTMPNAIQPDDEAYGGMTGASEGDVEKVDESAATRAERQAETPEHSPTQRVADDVLGEAPDDADDR
jgi:hypothetical protein